MALNLSLIGKRSEPLAFNYNEDQVILYALGIGADGGELPFIYEKNLSVIPTFAVLPAGPTVMSFFTALRLNVPAVLHAGQKVLLHKRIPSAGTVYTSGICRCIDDKGDRGAVIHLDMETRDKQGELLFENQVALVDRSAGNFGGQRGEKGERYDPPEGRGPDFLVDYRVSQNQAALYRLSGDKNPHHIDPEFARQSGLPRPILHGLCTMGFAGRAVLQTVCNGDPSRFRSLSAQFQDIVFPGDKLLIRGWEKSPGQYIIQTKTQDGRVVLGNALAEVV
jgi:acyl dehydratase